MRKHSRSIWSNCVLSILLSSLAGLALAFLCTILFSLVIRFILKDMGFAGIFAIASLITSSFTGAYLCGRYRRHHGMLIGAVCGIAIFIFISSAGIVISGNTAGIKKLLLLTISGMTGGVYGVNSKHPLKLTDQ